MSRQAEKINFADEYTRQVNDKTYESSIRKAEINKACLDAIDWADRTMLDKICNWIEYNAYLYEGISGYYMAKDLKKAMQ